MFWETSKKGETVNGVLVVIWVIKTASRKAVELDRLLKLALVKLSI